MSATKTFLFLQGPQSPFFSRLADKLEQKKHLCLRINLCFADWLFWRRPGARNYRGSLENWSSYLEHFYDSHGVTDLVLHSEQRDHHKIAIDLAKRRGLGVTVTDWGYLRPDWITLERDGMSGNTRFPKDRSAIFALAAGAPEPDLSSKYPESFPRLAFCNVCADLGNWFFALLYPGYRSHLPHNPIVGYLSTAWRMICAKLRKATTLRTIRDVVSKTPDRPCFIFPMQLDGDFQIRAYSGYSGMEETLGEVVASFARNAPPSALLVVKVHPWDPGMKPWRKIIGKLASSHAIPSRVVYVDGGSFEDLASVCAGVVTVNSTTGLAALKFGKPVKTLGESVYDIPGLTHQKHLDSFWTAAEAPDCRFCDAFVAAIAVSIQIKGGYFSKAGLEATLETAAARLAQDMVNHPWHADSFSLSATSSQTRGTPLACPAAA